MWLSWHGACLAYIMPWVSITWTGDVNLMVTWWVQGQPGIQAVLKQRQKIKQNIPKAISNYCPHILILLTDALMTRRKTILSPDPFFLSFGFSGQGFSLHQAILELMDPPIFASWVLGSKTCVTAPGLGSLFSIHENSSWMGRIKAVART